MAYWEFGSFTPVIGITGNNWGNTSLRLSQSINLNKAILVASLGIELFSVTSHAHALEGDVIRPYANINYIYDDNLRRFSNKQQALASTGSSNMADTVLTTGVGIILDKQISRQRFYADINVNKSNYTRNSELDNDGKEMTGRWNWYLGNQWNGNLELYHKEALVPFADFRGLELNLKTQNKRYFDAMWRFHSSWQARFSFTNNEISFSAPSQRAADLTENSEEIELDYLPSSSSKVGVVYRHAKGVKPEQFFSGMFISNDYNQDEIKLNADWAVTGKTKLQFLGGLVRRTHDELSQRDFSGVNARGNLILTPTGKTRLNFSMWRENNAQSFVTATYTLNRGASVIGSWFVTSKVTVQGTARYDMRDFVGDAVLGNERADRDKNVSLVLIYRPTMALMLNASVAHSTRSSTSSFLEYDSNSLSVSAQYEF